MAGFCIDNNGEFLLILKLVFDLVDRSPTSFNTLISSYRLSKSSLSCFQSCITDRHQFVTIHGSSKIRLPANKTRGIPQVSELVPIQFVNDIAIDIPLHLSSSSSSADILAYNTTIRARALFFEYSAH